MFSLGLGPPLPRARESVPPKDCSATIFQTLPGHGWVEVAPSLALGSSRGINIPAQVLLRSLLPATAPPTPPGKVILGWRDDNRKCICRLPSNFLMGASWKRLSCAVPLGLCSR